MATTYHISVAKAFYFFLPYRALPVVEPHAWLGPICNLYSHVSNQEAIRSLASFIREMAGNLQPQSGIFPDYKAPIVRNNQGTRELAMARWGMPSPAFALKRRNSDPGITNVRNVKSPHWRRWLGGGKSLCCALHQFFRKRGAGRWHTSACLVCPERGTPACFLCRHLDAAMEIHAQGQGRRDHE